MTQPIMLSEDVARSFPKDFGARYEILRWHEEEVRTGFLGLRKQKVKVIDNLKLTAIDVYTLDGSSWQVPLDSLTAENSQTSLETDRSRDSNSAET